MTLKPQSAWVVVDENGCIWFVRMSKDKTLEHQRRCQFPVCRQGKVIEVLITPLPKRKIKKIKK